MGATRPNILLVMADQMSALRLGLYGSGVARTPQLDTLTERGVVFENAYCNYPLCAPARFAMMTGRLPSRIGAYDNAAELTAATPTFAHYLRDAGYYTCLSGKMHFVGPDQLHGFERRLTTEIYPTDFSWTPLGSYETRAGAPSDAQAAPGVSSGETVTDAGPVARSMQLDYDEVVAARAVQEIYDIARSGAAPFMMTVSFTHPHDPYVISREYWDLYEGIEIDPPAVPFIPLEKRDPHSASLHFHLGLHRVEIDFEATLRARRGYYGAISYVDAKLGALLTALEEAGLAEDTVVIFTSDHGDMMGERGMWFKKTLFEPAVRVPLVVSWPKRLRSGRRSEPVSLVDILPTLCALADVPPERLVAPSDGHDLFAVDAGDHPPVVVEHIDGGTVAPRIMLREGALKYVHSPAYPPQLYDLDEDPLELTNLAGDRDYAQDEARLRAAVEAEWDLPALQAQVEADQSKRRFLARALAKGSVTSWDYEPRFDPARQFVRAGDQFPEVEQQGYLRYGGNPAPPRE